MIKIIKKIIGYRQDLNLERKWWHRFLMVLFAIFIIFCAIFWFSFIIEERLFIKQIETAPLDVRLDEYIRRPDDLVRNGETIKWKDGYIPYSFSDVYCSSELSKNIRLVQEITDASGFEINRKEVTLNSFTNYIDENNIKCVLLQEYSVYSFLMQDDVGKNGKYLSVIEESYENGISYFKVSFWKSATSFLVTSFIILFILFIAYFLILTLYYRVFIYIVYGKR